MVGDNRRTSTLDIRAGGVPAYPHPPSSLCSSQGSSAPKSLGARDSLQLPMESFTAQTRRGWIPVTGTGMREQAERPRLLISAERKTIICSDFTQFLQSNRPPFRPPLPQTPENSHLSRTAKSFPRTAHGSCIAICVVFK
ncbi:hypothetical protein CO670_16330 [Rhizobium sp. J15]|nr:hypothetical protein CO670_16330 [Rhizobium sp. J15]